MVTLGWSSVLALAVSHGSNSKFSFLPHLLAMILTALLFQETPAKMCYPTTGRKLLEQGTDMVMPWVSLPAFRLAWERDVVNPGYVCGDVSRGLTGVVGEESPQM